MKTFTILTLFPTIFDSYINESILKRAKKNKKIKVRVLNIRDYAEGKYKQVDDKPYGGGVGMVLQIAPIFRCLRKNRLIVFDKKSKKFRSKKDSAVILLDARGKTYTQTLARALTKYKELIFICGHYESIDERVRNLVDMSISIGDFVLTGGELPALAILDSVARLIPGVLGKDESSKHESFFTPGYLEYPHYSRPEVFEPEKGIEWKVPKILLSGHHKNIEEWREQKSSANH